MTFSFPLPADDARQFAAEWIAAWNSHDLSRILSHYAPSVVLTSPVAARLSGSATVEGIDNLRSYFALGLERFPRLHFDLIDVFTGYASLVLVYTNQTGTRTAEWMQFNEESKVVRVAAQYSA